VRDEHFLDDLGGFIRNFRPARQVLNGGHRLKIPGHQSIAYWPAKKRRLFRVSPSGDLYEPVTTAIMSFLQHRFPIQTIYDIGAGTGYFSLVAGSIEDKKPTIHAFEMDPKRHQAFEHILPGEAYSTGNIHAHLAGMSDHDEGERTVWRSLYRMYEERPPERDYREAWWRRLKFAIRGVHNRDALIETTVTLTSIDAFAAVHGAPDLIKLDVDGYEAKVIPGGLDTFRRHRPFLLFELHTDRRLKRFGSSREKLISTLFECGYRCVTFSNHHDCSKASVEPVAPKSAAVRRQRTDLFLLY
jgi:FkbM family methyltransferase